MESGFGNRYYLWDFKNGKIEKISLPENINKWRSISSEDIIIDPDDGFFYFFDVKDTMYRYDLKNRRYSEFSCPFEKNYFPVTGGA